MTNFRATECLMPQGITVLPVSHSTR